MKKKDPKIKGKHVAKADAAAAEEARADGSRGKHAAKKDSGEGAGSLSGEGVRSEDGGQPEEEEARTEQLDRPDRSEQDSDAAADATVAMPAEMRFGDDAYDGLEGAVGPAEAGAAAFGMDAVSEEDAAEKKRKRRKAAGIAAGVVVGILAIAYFAGAFFFSTRFFPQTSAGHMDLSMATVDEVRQELDQTVSDYQLVVTGQGFRLELDAQQAGISADSAAIVQSMHEDVNIWAWPIEVFGTHDETGKLAASYNESGLEELVRAAVEEFNADKTAPVNATIGFDEAADGFVVVPEQDGTKLDADAVVEAVDGALLTLTERVELTSDQLQQPTLFSDDPALQKAADQANTMITADVTLTMAGDVAAEVNAALISQWIVLDENLNASLDQGALTAWVDQLTANCNTVGTTRTYTRADGKQITVSGGVYGWEVDRDTLLAQVQEAVAAGTTGTQEIPVWSSGSAYNGPGERDWGNRYCDIDLAEQHVRFYDESGALVWESDCISGTPDGQHDTWTGVYWINGKESPSTLIGYENGKKIYESKVSYWMPFVDNSIGLHDANWQPAFGGSMYAQGYGSHGCVNLPVDKAAELYNIIQPGDCVVSHW